MHEVQSTNQTFFRSELESHNKTLLLQDSEKGDFHEEKEKKMRVAVESEPFSRSLRFESTSGLGVKSRARTSCR